MDLMRFVTGIKRWLLDIFSTVTRRGKAVVEQPVDLETLEPRVLLSSSQTPSFSFIEFNDTSYADGSTITVNEGDGIVVDGEFDGLNFTSYYYYYDDEYYYGYKSSYDYDNHSVMLDWGDGTQDTMDGSSGYFGDPTEAFDDEYAGTYSPGSDGYFASPYHYFGDSVTAYTLTVTVDNGDNDSDTQTFYINVQEVAPFIEIDGAAVEVGVDYTLNLTYEDESGADTVDDWIINWGDGSAEETVDDGSLTSVTHVYETADTYPVTVKALSSDGKTHGYNALTPASDPDDGSAYVVSIDAVINGPSLVVSGASTSGPGDLYTLTLDATGAVDAQGNSDTVTLWHIDWGDGSSDVDVPGGQTSKDHTYQTVNATPYVIKVTATGGNEDHSAAPKSVTVEDFNFEPVLGVLGDLVVDEGVALNFVGSLTDANTSQFHTAEVSWDWDNDPTFVSITTTKGNPGEPTALSGVHTYADNGVYTVKVRVTDIASSALSDEGTFSVTVNQVEPDIQLTGDSELKAGVDFNLSIAVGATSNTEVDAIASWKILWGDGQISYPTSIASPISHPYGSVLAYEITVEATDVKGDVFTREHVVNVAPVIDALPDIQVDESDLYNLVATFVDADADTHTATIDWGDGSSKTVNNITGNSFSATHRFDGTDSYNVKVTVTDQLGAVSQEESFDVDSAEVPPHVYLEVGGTTDKSHLLETDDSLTLDLKAELDPGMVAGFDSIVSWDIDWGDGNTSAGDLNTMSASHPYGAEGNFIVQTTVTDDDGNVYTTANLLVSVYTPLTAAEKAADHNNDGVVDQDDQDLIDNYDYNYDGVIDQDDIDYYLGIYEDDQDDYYMNGGTYSYDYYDDYSYDDYYYYGYYDDYGNYNSSGEEVWWREWTWWNDNPYENWNWCGTGTGSGGGGYNWDDNWGGHWGGTWGSTWGSTGSNIGGTVDEVVWDSPVSDGGGAIHIIWKDEPSVYQDTKNAEIFLDMYVFPMYEGEDGLVRAQGSLDYLRTNDYVGLEGVNYLREYGADHFRISWSENNGSTTVLTGSDVSSYLHVIPTLEGTVDWGDGSTSTLTLEQLVDESGSVWYNTSPDFLTNTVHQYQEPGTYDITLTYSNPARVVETSWDQKGYPDKVYDVQFKKVGDLVKKYSVTVYPGQSTNTGSPAGGGGEGGGTNSDPNISMRQHFAVDEWETLAFSPAVTGFDEFVDVVVSWGDGSNSTTLLDVPSAQIDLSHIYQQNLVSGDYSAGLTITDDSGNSGTSSFLVTVHDVAANMDAIPDTLSVKVDKPYSINLLATHDAPSYDTIESWAVVWPGETAPDLYVGNDLNVTHAFTDQNDIGRHTIKVTSFDDTGRSTTKEIEVTVGSEFVYSEDKVGAADRLDEGEDATFDFEVAGLTGSASYTIVWGDSSPNSTGTVTGDTFSVNHIYADADPDVGARHVVFNPTVTVMHDGGQVSHSFSVEVKDVKLTIDLSNNANHHYLGVGQTPTPYTINFASLNDDPAGVLDAVTDWSIHWGEYGSEPELLNNANATSATHTYTDTGLMTIVVSAIYDGDKKYASSFEVDVSDQIIEAYIGDLNNPSQPDPNSTPVIMVNSGNVNSTVGNNRILDDIDFDSLTGDPLFTPLLIDLSQSGYDPGSGHLEFIFEESRVYSVALGTTPVETYTHANAYGAGLTAPEPGFLRISTLNSDAAREANVNGHFIGNAEHWRQEEKLQDVDYSNHYKIPISSLTIVNGVATFWVEAVAPYKDATTPIDDTKSIEIAYYDDDGKRVSKDNVTFTLEHPTSGTATVEGHVFHDRNDNKLWDNKLVEGDNPNVIFALDVSGSSMWVFEDNDVNPNILDAEVNAFIDFNRQLINLGLGDTATVSIIAYSNMAHAMEMDITNIVLDVNPEADNLDDLNLAAITPATDKDRNGVPDVEDILRKVLYDFTEFAGPYGEWQNAYSYLFPDTMELGPTNLDVAVDKVVELVTKLDPEPGNANVFFLTDGVALAEDRNDVLESVDTFRNHENSEGEAYDINIRGFGIGANPVMSDMQLIDPGAIALTNADQLLALFNHYRYGEAPEAPLEGWAVYLDYNRNGVHEPLLGEASVLTDASGAYSFSGVASGRIPIRLVPPAETDDVIWNVNAPDAGYHTAVILPGDSLSRLDFGAHEQIKETSNLKLRASDFVVTVVGDTDGDGAVSLGEGETLSVLVELADEQKAFYQGVHGNTPLRYSYNIDYHNDGDSGRYAEPGDVYRTTSSEFHWTTDDGDAAHTVSIYVSDAAGDMVELTTGVDYANPEPVSVAVSDVLHTVQLQGLPSMIEWELDEVGNDPILHFAGLIDDASVADRLLGGLEYTLTVLRNGVALDVFGDPGSLVNYVTGTTEQGNAASAYLQFSFAVPSLELATGDSYLITLDVEDEVLGETVSASATVEVIKENPQILDVTGEFYLEEDGTTIYPFGYLFTIAAEDGGVVDGIDLGYAWEIPDSFIYDLGYYRANNKSLPHTYSNEARELAVFMTEAGDFTLTAYVFDEDGNRDEHTFDFTVAQIPDSIRIDPDPIYFVDDNDTNTGGTKDLTFTVLDQYGDPMSGEVTETSVVWTTNSTTWSLDENPIVSISGNTITYDGSDIPEGNPDEDWVTASMGITLTYPYETTPKTITIEGLAEILLVDEVDVEIVSGATNADYFLDVEINSAYDTENNIYVAGSGMAGFFNPLDVDPDPSAFKANIIWGDGSTTTDVPVQKVSLYGNAVLEAFAPLTGSHAYTEPGFYDYSVELIRASDSALLDTATGKIWVNAPETDAPHQTVAFNPYEGIEFSGALLNIALPTDDLGSYSFTIDWGDETVQEVNPTLTINNSLSSNLNGDPYYSITGTHTYAQDEIVPYNYAFKELIAKVYIDYDDGSTITTTQVTLPIDVIANRPDTGPIDFQLSPDQHRVVSQLLTDTPDAQGNTINSPFETYLMWEHIPEDSASSYSTHQVGYLLWAFDPESGVKHRIPGDLNKQLAYTPEQGDPDVNFYLHSSLKPDTQYIYTVQAIYPNGIISAESAPLSVTTQTVDRPDLPLATTGAHVVATDFTTRIREEGVQLFWEPDPEVNGYRVFRQIDANTWIDLYEDPEVEGTPDKRLIDFTSGDDWTASISMVEAADGGSDFYLIDPEDLYEEGYVATFDAMYNRDLTITDPLWEWKAGDPEFNTYLVVAYQIMDSISKQFLIPSVAYGVTTGAFTVNPDTEAPGATENLEAASYPQAIQLSWTDRPEDEGLDFAGWNVYSWKGTGAPDPDLYDSTEKNDWVKKNYEPLIEELGYNDYHAPVGEMSYYMVRTTDKLGNESLPEFVEHKRSTNGEPPKPTGLMGYTLSSTSINLIWDRVKPIQHLGSEGDSLKGYNIYQRELETDPWAIAGSVVGDPSDPSFTVTTGIVANKTYTFAVTSVDNDITVDESPKTLVTVATGDGLAPTKPTLAQSGEVVDLDTFTVSVDITITDQSAGGASAFRVFRQSGDGAAFEYLFDIANANINGDSPVTLTTFSEIDLETNTQYTYRVAAIDKVDSDVSDFASIIVSTSNVAEAAPNIEIVSPNVVGAIQTLLINEDTDVMGIIDDPNSNLASWKLELVFQGGGEEQAPILIAEGIEEIGQFNGDPANDGIVGKIGTIQPTMIPNGLYALRLSATDNAGSAPASTYVQGIEIHTDIKLGGFNLPVIDLVYEVPGQDPIIVKRVYDSTTAHHSDDFGFGWTLEFNDSNLRTTATSVPDTTFNDLYPALEDGDLVYVDVPNQGTYTFMFRAKDLGYDEQNLSASYAFIKSIVGSALTYEPYFVSVDGSGAALGVDFDSTIQNLQLLDGKAVIRLDSGDVVGYNPANRGLGGHYVLRTANGTIFDINAHDGKITSTVDANGHAKSLSDDEAQSDYDNDINIGRKLYFHRDDSGRIISVGTALSPTENTVLVSYTYNDAGDLIEVADAEKNTTQYSYDTNLAHHLTDVIDSQGVDVVDVIYDPNSRQVKSVRNLNDDSDTAYTDISSSGFDGETGFQVSHDNDGNEVERLFNSRGDVVREIKTLFDDNGDPTHYLVNVFEFDYVEEEAMGYDPLFAKQSFTYNGQSFDFGISGINQLRLKVEYQPYLVDLGTHSPNMRYSHQPETVLSQVEYKTLDPNQSLPLSETPDIDSPDFIEGYGQPLVESTLAPDGTTLNRYYGYEWIDNGESGLSADDGHLVISVDPQGQTTHNYYDAAFNLYQTTITDVNDVLLQDLRIVYTNSSTHSNLPAGLLLSSADHTDPLNVIPLITNTYYDSDEQPWLIGKLHTTTDDFGVTLEYIYKDKRDNQYTLVGSVVEVRRQWVDSQGTHDILESHIEKDRLGRVTLSWSASDNPDQFVNEYEYSKDAADNHNALTYYDSNGQVLVVTDTLGNSTFNTYDVIGNLIRTLNPDGSETRIAYDSLGRVAYTSTAFESSSSATWDADLEVLAWNSNDNTAEYGVTENVYDELGRLVETIQHANAQLEITNADHSETAVIYKTVANLGSASVISGTITSYDNEGRPLVFESYIPDSADPSIKIILNRNTTSYNAYGYVKDTQTEVLNTENDVIEITTLTRYAYDVLGNVVATINYQPNKTDGQLVIVSQQRTVYDSLGRVLYATDNYDPGADPTIIAGSHQEFDSKQRPVETQQLRGLQIDLVAVLNSTVIGPNENFNPLVLYVTQLSTPNDPGLVTSKTQTIYDKYGRTIATSNYLVDLDNTANYIHTRESRSIYDQHGRIEYTATYVPATSNANYLDGDPLNNPVVVTHFTFDELGRVTQVDNLQGALISLNIDDPKDALTQIDTTGSTTLSSTTKGYDSYNRLAYAITTRDPDGVPVKSATLYSYDGLGRQTESAVDPNGVFLLSDPNDTDNQDQIVSKTEYTPLGQVHATIDAMQRRTEFTYDALGNNIETEKFDDQGVSLSITTSTFDLRGRRTSHTDELEATTYYRYDEHGRLTSVTLPEADSVNPATDTVESLAARYEYTYDIFDNQTALHDNIFAAINDNLLIDDPSDDIITADSTNQRTTDFAYDHSGNRISRSLPSADGVAARLTETKIFDSSTGQLVSEVDLQGRKTKYYYDILNRVSQIRFFDDAADLTPDHATQNTYDDYGKLTSQVTLIDDPNYTPDLAADFSGDGFFDLVDVDLLSVAINAGSTDLLYDLNGDTFVTADDGIYFITEILGSVPGDYNLDYVVDVADNIVWAQGFGPGSVYSEGDGNFDGAVNIADLIIYANVHGAVLDAPWYFIEDAGSETSYSYNDYGQTTVVDSPEGILRYEYDASTGGLVRTSTGASAGNPVNDTSYGYDSLGRLETVTAVERNGVALSGEVTTYGYYADGILESIEHPNGVFSYYTFNGLGSIDTLTHYETSSQSTVIASFDYDYFANGNRKSEIATDANGDIATTAWQYDAMGRLIEESLTVDPTNPAPSLTNYVTTYTFDLVGNRTQMAQAYDTDGDGTTDYTLTTTYDYDSIDRFITVIADHSADNTQDRYTVYSYDGTDQVGEAVYVGLVAGTYALETTTQVYNAEGRLETVVIVKDANSDGVAESTTTSSYAYNRKGIRTQKIVDDGTTAVAIDYLVDSNNPTGYAQVLEEYNNATSKRTTYTIGLRVLAQYEELTPLYLLTDAHGSTRLVTDSALAALTLYFYDAYGNMLGDVDPASVGTTILYSGEQFDATTGNQYLRARYYDPTTGRFNRLDPFFGDLTNPQSFNKYLYTHGNPIMGVDPTGLFTIVGLMASTSIMSNLQSMKIGVDGAVYESFQSATESIEAGLDTQHALIKFFVDGSTDLFLGFAAGKVLGLISDILGGGITVSFNKRARTGVRPGCFVEGTPVWIANTNQEVVRDTAIAGVGLMENNLSNPYQRYMLASGLISFSIIQYLANNRKRKRSDGVNWIKIA